VWKKARGCLAKKYEHASVDKLSFIVRGGSSEDEFTTPWKETKNQFGAKRGRKEKPKKNPI